MTWRYRYISNGKVKSSNKFAYSNLMGAWLNLFLIYLPDELSDPFEFMGGSHY